MGFYCSEVTADENAHFLPLLLQMDDGDIASDMRSILM